MEIQRKLVLVISNSIRANNVVDARPLVPDLLDDLTRVHEGVTEAEIVTADETAAGVVAVVVIAHGRARAIDLGADRDPLLETVVVATPAVATVAATREARLGTFFP